MTQEEWLLRFPFLEQMPESERQYFIRSAVLRQLHAGEIVMRDYSNCSGVIFTLSGELKVYKVSESGRELSLYSVHAGETALLSLNCSFTEGITVPDVSLAAVQDSRIAVLPCSAFCYLFSTSPPMQRFAVSCVFRKFNEVIGLVEKLTFQSVGGRVYDYILENTHAGRIPLYTTHAQLAARLGTSREVVTRCLRRMQSKGLIRTERGKIALLRKETATNKQAGGIG